MRKNCDGEEKGVDASEEGRVELQPVVTVEEAMEHERASERAQVDEQPTKEEAAETYQDAWLADRSRWEDGISWCPRARFLRYHSGPSGYGYSLKAMAMAPVTGTYTHDMVAELLLAKACAMDPVVTRLAAPGSIATPKQIIEKHVQRYKTVCAARGFQEGVAEELDQYIQEQAALVEAYGWASWHYWIPQLLEDWDPVLVEKEINVELTTEPQRLILMLRPDLVMRNRTSGMLAQFDFKTTGALTFPAWRRQWEDNGQLALQGFGAERELQERVDISYIYALDKGRKEQKKDRPEGMLRQISPLIYAYHKPAGPGPGERDDWKLKYDWVDEFGERRRLGKGYTRRGTFDYAWPGAPAGMSSVEVWVRSIGADGAAQAREILGPYQTTEHMRERILQAFVGEEIRWQGKVWMIYDAAERAGWDETSPDYQKVLDTEAPQTWMCHKYGKDCQFLRVCTDPKRVPPHQRAEGDFVLRRPHHEAEVVQMQARGIALPPAQDGSDEDAE